MKKTTLLFAILLSSGLVFAQKNAFVAFWNVENLYDTIDDPAVKDEEFLPGAKNAWTQQRYETKLRNTAQVIASMNDSTGPDILGMAEVENKRVLEDLVRQPVLKKMNYGIVHFDSPDQRGIDVALLFKTKSFRVLSTSSVKTRQPSDTLLPTRNILVVRGILNKKDTVCFVVNHWPSRRGGKDDSEERRMFAAGTLRSIHDSLLSLYPGVQVIAMGDFNDEPTDKSLRSLCAPSNDLQIPIFINTMDSIDATGAGTHYYKGEKSCLDQILVTPSVKVQKGYYADRSMIISRPWMFAEVYKNDGLSPKRTWAGSRYIGGYSDHLPVGITLRLAR